MQEQLKMMVCWIHENGLADTIYLVLQFSALTLCLIMAARLGTKFGFGFMQAFVAVTIEVGMVYGEMAVLCEILDSLVPAHIPIMNSYYNNVGRTFILVPLSGLLVSWVMKADMKKIMAIYSFAQPIIWGLASLPCLLAGCCRGYPWKWGVYNYEEQTFLFPTQLVNAVLLSMLAGFTVYRAKKMKYQPDGYEYPLALIVIGLIRFSTEFIMDSPKIVWGWSSLSFDSLVMVATGCILCAAISIYKRSRRNLRVPI